MSESLDLFVLPHHLFTFTDQYDLQIVGSFAFQLELRFLDIEFSLDRCDRVLADLAFMVEVSQLTLKVILRALETCRDAPL